MKLKYPKIKNATLSIILTYVVVLGVFILPIVIVMSLPWISDITKVTFFIVMVLAMLVYLIRNFVVLMSMEIMLTTLKCHLSARKQFEVLDGYDVGDIENELSRFGVRCEPITRAPIPDILRYKAKASHTVYAKGTEMVVAAYRVSKLDKDIYNKVFRSANANSRALIGKKKLVFLDKEQKTAPLKRVTVIIIFAETVEERLSEELFELVCKNDGDGMDNAIVPCVVDISQKTCVFNCMRIPSLGYGNPVKNYGIRIVRKCVFGGVLPVENNDKKLEPIKDIDPEQSLWDFWRSIYKETVGIERENRKRYKSMQHKEIIFEDDFLYVKWEDRGILTAVSLDEQKKIAEIDTIEFWEYPKKHKIAKKTKAEIENMISEYFSERGYSCDFLSFDD